MDRKKKREIKIERIHEATIKTVNEHGFVDASCAKIAKAANVSPATIYLCHENKEGLIVTTFLRVYEFIIEQCYVYDKTDDPEHIFKTFYKNLLRCVRSNPEEVQYLGLFFSSPYVKLIDLQELNQNSLPEFNKFFKDKNHQIIESFFFGSATFLSNTFVYPNFVLTDANLILAADAMWAAVNVFLNSNDHQTP
jgi:TetR/AcrR family transcriptional regulator, repressor of fatR-cypB operon